MEKTAAGVKNDGGKARWDLLSGDALQEAAEIMTLGAVKYAPRNYLKGIAWGRYFAAAMRHLWGWWRGEDYDQETGKSHLSHALCCIMILRDLSIHRPEFDDRPKSGHS